MPISPVDHDPFAEAGPVVAAPKGKLRAVDHDPFAAEPERGWLEAGYDRVLGIGKAGLGIGESIVNTANQRTPWDGVPLGATAFNALEAGSGLMGAFSEYLPDLINDPVAATRMGLAETRAADPNAGQPASFALQDVARYLGDYADTAGVFQSAKEKDTQKRLAEASKAGLIPAAKEILTNPSALATVSDSLIPSLSLGGAVGLGAKGLGFAEGAATVAQLGSMAGVEGAGAGEGAFASVMQADERMLFHDPVYQRLLEMTGDPAQARAILADTARSVSTTTGTATSALLQGLSQKLGFNVAENTLLGRISKGQTGSRTANAALGGVKETVGEGIEGGANQLAQNVGTIAGGADYDPWRGVGGAAATEALAAGPMGVLAGALQSPNVPKAPPAIPEPLLPDLAAAIESPPVVPPASSSDQAAQPAAGGDLASVLASIPPEVVAQVTQAVPGLADVLPGSMGNPIDVPAERLVGKATDLPPIRQNVPRSDSVPAPTAETVAAPASQAGSMQASPKRSTLADALAMPEDEYIAAVNPSGKRISPEDRVILKSEDMDTPAEAVPAMTLADKAGAPVELLRTPTGLFAQIDGKTVGSIEIENGETLNTVAEDYQGRGIGTILAREFIRENPLAPSGGFSEAGEATRRKAFRELQGEAKAKRTRLPGPASLSVPLAPTREDMQRAARVEEVPLDRVASPQTEMRWDDFDARKGPGDLIEGYGDMPVAVRMRDGEFRIYDGNHRTADALARGAKSMPMHVIDAATYDPENAGKAPAPKRSIAEELADDDALLAALTEPTEDTNARLPRETLPQERTPEAGRTAGAGLADALAERTGAAAPPRASEAEGVESDVGRDGLPRVRTPDEIAATRPALQAERERNRALNEKADALANRVLAERRGSAPAPAGSPQRRAGDSAPPSASAPAAAPRAPDPKATSTKNATVDRERAERGADPIIRAASQSNRETLDKAQAALTENPNFAQEAAEKLRTQGDASISVTEEAALLVEKVNQRKRRDDAALRASDPKLSPEQRAVAKREWDDAEARINDIDQATAASGREWGRLGQFRQRMIREDFTFEALERRERVRKERPLTAEESAKLKEYADRVQTLEAELRTAQQAKDDYEAQEGAMVAYRALVQEMAKAGPARSTLPKIKADAARAREALGLAPAPVAAKPKKPRPANFSAGAYLAGLARGGGLNATEFKRLLGWSDRDLKGSIPGLWRAGNGGMTLDRLRESMEQSDLLPPDSYDDDALQILAAALRGDDVRPISDDSRVMVEAARREAADDPGAPGDDVPFSRPAQGAGRFEAFDIGMSETDLSAAIRDIVREWRGDAPAVEVVQDADALPDEAKTGRDWQTVEGWYDGTGKVWLVASNLANSARGLQVLAHEAVGHYGVEGVLGRQGWQRVLTDVAAMKADKSGLSADVRGALESTLRRYPDADPTLFAREFLAVMAERGVTGGLIDRVLAALRRFLRSLGFNPRSFSESELRTILADAARSVERSAGVRDAAMRGPAQSRGKRMTEETRQENFRRWSNNAPLVTRSDAGTYDFRSGQKVVVEAVHGTARPDRIGKGFDARRATSGPMAFFTSDANIGSNYATGKQDTSLDYEEQGFASWFKVRVPGYRSQMAIDRAWWSLPSDVRQRITALAPRVAMDDAGENVILEPEGHATGIGNFDYEVKQARGNMLQALVESWLSSGSIYGDEGRFMDVLKAAGMPMDSVTFDSPTATYPALIPVHVAMQSPLVTSDLPADVVPALRSAAKRDRSRAAQGGSDAWDKNTRTLRDWVADFVTDAGISDSAWTTIPDKVTDVLRSLGYDGIVDTGGKMGGEKHRVYIPFGEGQVKGQFNRGTYDADKKRDLLFSRPAVSPVEFFNLSTIGAEVVAVQGVTTLEDFTAAMRGQLGAQFDKFAEALPQAFEAAKLRAGGVATERAIDPENITTRDIYNLARKHVQAGVQGEDAVMRAVHADVKALRDDMTERDVRRLFSEYGKVLFPSKEADKVALRELRSLVQMQESIDRMSEGLAALKSGPQRDKATQAVREKRRALNDMLKRASRQAGNDPEKLASYQQARITNLSNQIADIEKQIATGERPKRAAPPPITPEIEALVAQRDALLKERAMIDNPKATPEERYQRTRAKQLARQLEEVKARIAANDYARRPRPEAKKLDAANTEAKLKLLQAKAEFAKRQFEEEMAQRSPLGKVFGYGKEATNLARSYLTSLDFSGLLRQGGFITLGHPVRAAKAVPSMMGAFKSEAGALKAAEALKARPNAELYARFKLDLTEYDNLGVSQAKVEEAFQSRWIERMPQWALGGLVRGSQRAYTTVLNQIRADSFDAMVASLAKSKVPTEAEGKAIANFINVATGRGKIGLNNHTTSATGLNTIFFAPRLVASRLNLLALQPLYGGTLRTRGMIAAEYARFMMGVSVVFGLAALAADDEDDEPLVSFDPRSSNFLKIKFNNTYLDPMTGLSQVTVFLARALTGETVSTSGRVSPLRSSYRLSDSGFFGEALPRELDYGGQTTWNVITNFVRTKLAPIPGAIATLATGENVIGQPQTPGDVLAGLVVPISFQETGFALRWDEPAKPGDVVYTEVGDLSLHDVGGLMTDNGLPKSAAIFAVSLLGVGAQYRKPDERALKGRLADIKDDAGVEAELDHIKGQYPKEVTDGLVLDKYADNGENKKLGRAGKIKRDDLGAPMFKPPTPTQEIVKELRNAPAVEEVMPRDFPKLGNASVREAFKGGALGVFSPEEAKVYIAKNMSTANEQFTAFHEIAGHYGVQGVLGDKYEAVMNRAMLNPTVDTLAKAMQAKAYGDLYQLQATEEALSELAAANRTENYALIEERWGVKIPPSARNNLRGMLSRVAQMTKRELADLTGEEPKAYDDDQVFDLLESAYQFVKEPKEP